METMVDTVLKEKHTYKRGAAAGVTVMIPDEWIFTRNRADSLLLKNAK